MVIRTKVLRRFLSKVSEGEPNACWEYQGDRNRRGYGVVYLPRTRTGPRPRELAHRVAWVIENGPIPPETPYILHSCDNPPCCNPAHLRAGTLQDNVQDRVERRRNALWDRYPHTKLTPEMVADARVRSAGGENQAALARSFGVSQSTISEALRGITWAHV